MTITQSENPSIVFYNESYWLRVDFPPSANPKPRWSKGHESLNQLLNNHHNQYIIWLAKILDHSNEFVTIPIFRDGIDSSSPYYYNNFIPALDGMSLYTFIAERAPHNYIEIGSGNSTKFARRAIENQSTNTKIISIDPQPRAKIDLLCDQFTRQPLENVPLTFFEQLKAGDILVFDGSHRSFINSDATIFFLDILPRLEPGVLVGIHDIFLPWDYPGEWGASRWYNEQYLLMAYLLGGGKDIKIILPNTYVSRTPALLSILDPLWDRLEPKWKSRESPGVEPWGAFFWMQTK